MQNKGNLFLKMLPLAVAGIFIFSSAEISAQDGEAIFNQSCKACHTIGGGKVVGPDLKGITSKRSEDWLLKWTKSSQSLINSGDTDAKAIFEEFNKVPMPDQNFTDAEIKSIYAYVGKQGGGETTVASTTEVAPQQMPNMDNPSEELVALGQKLFEGRIFVNGGPSCISCHNVNSSRVIPGGLLAKDLTTSYSRLGGFAGVSAFMKAPPAGPMSEAFKNNQLTDKEINAIAAFLSVVDKENTAKPQAEQMSPLATWGIAGLVAWIILVLILWMNRKKNTVKKAIYDRQVKSY